MVDFVSRHGWALVLWFSVVLVWFLVGWAKLAAPAAKQPSPPVQPPAGRWGSWREDLREAAEAGDLERLCDRWRGRVPEKDR